MRRVRNERVMLKALTNELLKVLLQPVKMLLPGCSPLPGPPAPCKARGTEDVLPPRPWSSLVCVSLAMGGDGRSCKVEGGARRHTLCPTDLVHRQ